MDVSLINPFIAATMMVFETMTSLKPARKKVFIKNDVGLEGDISGVMGLSGEISGSVVISMSEHLATEVVSKMVQEEPAQLSSEEISDGVCELVNVISGNAKAKLSDTKYRFSISLPAVISSKGGHVIRHKMSTPCIVAVFSLGNEEFAVQVCVSQDGCGCRT